jgi:hypothetical protein
MKKTVILKENEVVLLLEKIIDETTKKNKKTVNESKEKSISKKDLIKSLRKFKPKVK